MTKKSMNQGGITRRSMIKVGAAAVGGAALAPTFSLPFSALAAEPPVGTFPAGIGADSVFVGIAVPLTGVYGADGADESKGMELAIEHINSGNALMRKISPKTKKGVLGKQIKYAIADQQAKPNEAVQAQTRFVTENKAIMIAGSVSSAVAVAINKLADREKVIYLPGITGSNDTTGKDCVRYSFRACHYAYTAAAAIIPLMIKKLGRNKKVAYLTPDYTYGHSVQESVEQFGKEGGWTTATNQVSPLGSPDFSSFMLNIANSGADVFINIGFGNDAVISIKQAKQFGILDKMTLVMPYNSPFLAKEVGPELMQGVYGTTEFWWTMAEKNSMAKEFVDAFDAKYGYKPEWGAHVGYLQFALWAHMVEQAGTFYPPDVIKSYEKGTKVQTDLGTVWFRAADHQLVRPVVIVRGKKPAEMRNKDDFYDIVEIVPGEGLMQKPDAFGCKLGAYA